MRARGAMPSVPQAETADERLGRFLQIEDSHKAAACAVDIARSVLKMMAGAIHGGNDGTDGDKLNAIDAADRLIVEAQERLDDLEVALRHFLVEQRAAAEAEAVSKTARKAAR